MKQQWQASYMAAAFKASEDEWERASSVSGPTRTSNHQSAQMQPQYPYHPGFPPPPAMPMHMSTPFPPHYMYPGHQLFPPYGPGMPQLPYGQPQNFLSQAPIAQSMGYQYGAGAQSVYGGGFGPASHQTHSASQHSLAAYNNMAAGAGIHEARSRRLSSTSQALYGTGSTGQLKTEFIPLKSGSSLSPRREAVGPSVPSNHKVPSPPPPSSWRRSSSGLGREGNAPAPSSMSRPVSFYAT